MPPAATTHNSTASPHVNDFKEHLASKMYLHDSQCSMLIIIIQDISLALTTIITWRQHTPVDMLKHNEYITKPCRLRSKHAPDGSHLPSILTEINPYSLHTLTHAHAPICMPINTNCKLHLIATLHASFCLPRPSPMMLQATFRPPCPIWNGPCVWPHERGICCISWHPFGCQQHPGMMQCGAPGCPHLLHLTTQKGPSFRPNSIACIDQEEQKTRKKIWGRSSYRNE